jgi:hypothetical protein
VKLIKFCLAFSLFAASGVLLSSDFSKSTHSSPEIFCRIFMTRSVNPELSELVQEALAKRFRGPCVVSNQWLADPLSPKDRRLYRNSAAVFAVAVDFNKQRDEIALSLFSPNSGLRWAHSNRHLSATSAVGAKSVISDLVDNALSQFPFVGVWDSQAIYSWGATNDLKVKAVEPGAPVVHPFLPQEKWEPADLAPPISMRLIRRGNEWSLSRADGVSPSAPTKRLWLSEIRD